MEAAAKFLAGQDYKVSGLLGHSKSGTGVVLHASTYGTVPVIVVCAGRYDCKRGNCLLSSSHPDNHSQDFVYNFHMKLHPQGRGKGYPIEEVNCKK